MDPAGPIPYRFEPDELAALAAGRLPGTDEPIFDTAPGRSLRVSLPGPETMQLEAALADALRGSGVEAAWLVRAQDDGPSRLVLGLLGDDGASVTVDVPDGTDVIWLEPPLLDSVRAVAEPFYRRDR